MSLKHVPDVFDPTSLDPNFRSPIADVTPPAPPVFPKFPSLEEMRLHDLGVLKHPLMLADPPKAPPASLFQGMMGGNLPALVQDSVDHPERYDADTQLFLSELGAGARKLETLTAEEKAHLDRAVLDFASFKPKRPAPPPPRLGLERPKSVAPYDPYSPGLQDGRAPQVEAAGGVMTPYWWLNDSRS